jgi:hypothetical protein
MTVLNLDNEVPAMRQPVRFDPDADTRISPISEEATTPIQPRFRHTVTRPRLAIDSAVRRNNSSAVRAILVAVLVILLAMLAYLMSLSSHPSVTDLSPKPGTVAEPGLVTVEARVGAAKPIKEVTLSIDGVQRSPAVVTLGDRSWIVRFRSVLPRGTHKAIVNVRDMNGSQQSQAWSFDAAGPRISPTIAFSDPPSDATLAQGLLWIHATAESDVDITSATLTVNGEEIPIRLTPETTTPSASTSDQSSKTQEWEVGAEHAFSAGNYIAHLTATDAQGDKTESEWHFSVTSDPAKASARYFSAAKLYVSGQFLTYWESHDGSLLFGNPVSPRFTNDQGTVVQYFEKARFEVGKDGGVALGLLGDEAIGSTQEPVKKPDGFNGDYFDATGHTLAGKFLDFWQQHGALQIFGYPISEVLDQNGTKVQYFERARFELAKDADGTTMVRLTPLGSQIWDSKQASPSQ